MHLQEKLSPHRHWKILLWFLLATLGAVAIIISRRPDVLFEPEFWAEEGTVWYQQAYNLGPLRALLTPYAGYFQTVPRLVVAASLGIPLNWVPALFSAVAVAIQALPALFLLSARMAHVLPNVWVRVLAAFFLLGLPNTQEVHASLTNSQQHFAVLACLVVIATPAPTRVWRVFDLATLLLGGLSAPQSIFLAPLAVVRWWVCRERSLLINAAAISLAAAVQGTAYVLVGTDTRIDLPLGVGLQNFSALFSGQVLLSPFLGASGYSKIYEWGWSELLWIPVVVTLLGVLLITYVLVKARLELKLFIIFAGLVFGANLYSPLVGSAPRWEAMIAPLAAGRYYFLPMLAWIATLLWLAFRAPSRWQRGIGVGLLAIMLLVGVPTDWRYPAYADMPLERHERRLERAEPGEEVRIPINPPGWTMTLEKRDE